MSLRLNKYFLHREVLQVQEVVVEVEIKEEEVEVHLRLQYSLKQLNYLGQQIQVEL
jgi:D-ribose pyranose/furanose isomerase RbsD